MNVQIPLRSIVLNFVKIALNEAGNGPIVWKKHTSYILNLIVPIKFDYPGPEPWSSGYGRRLTFKRSWVRILAPYTGWTFGHFFTLICCKIVPIVCLKRPKINGKEAGVAPFKNILKVFPRMQWSLPTLAASCPSPSGQTFELQSDCSFSRLNVAGRRRRRFASKIPSFPCSTFAPKVKNDYFTPTQLSRY